MKRIVSLVLAAVLVLAPCVQGFATDLEPKQQEAVSQDESSLVNPMTREGGTPEDGLTVGTPEDPADSKDSGEENGGGTPGDPSDAEPAEGPDAGTEIIMEGEPEVTEAASDVKGQIDVYIMQALAFKSDITFTVSLTGTSPAVDTKSKEITFKAGETDPAALQRGVTFDNLENGSYTLSISAPGYRTRTRAIEVQGLAYKLTYSTGFLGWYTYTKDTKHPGVLRIGDVNKDGNINDVDKNLLVDKIDAMLEDSVAENASEDLNLDKKVDLADLNYFVQGYFKQGEDPDASASIETNVPASVITPKASVDTNAKGLENLLRGEGAVELSPVNGKPISEKNPVTLEFEFNENVQTDGIVIDSNELNPIDTGNVEVYYSYKDDAGNVVEPAEPVKIPLVQKGIETLLTVNGVKVDKDDYGNIVIDLGSQIAVKRVTLTITGTKKNNNLAEISKVEFVNGMENRIPEPARDIPKELKTDVVGNKTFTVSWNQCVNVMGYEVRIKGFIEEGEEKVEAEEVVSVRGNSLSVSSLNEGKLVNNSPYEVSVQSVNGAWKSGFCEPISVTTKVDKAPPAPDYVNAIGKFKAIDVSWKKMKDTDYFNVYYREAGTEEYTKVEKIEESKFTISDLKDKTDYELYVTGVNEKGESEPSKLAVASTTDQNPAQMPKYKLLNRAEKGQVSEIFESAVLGSGEMQDSPLDTEKGTAWGTVDNTPTSHYFMNTWDGGGFNPMGGRGLIYTFKETYTMDRIALQEVSPQSQNYGYAQVRYWDGAGTEHVIPRGSIRVIKKQDSEGRVYYMLRFPGPIEVKKIQFALSRSYVYGTISVSEVYFYDYDSLEEDIMALYTDDLHTVLREDVTQATIDALKKRINTVDPVSKEYHPDKKYLEQELQTAQDILDCKDLGKAVEVHNTINTRDAGRGFGGLNSWQPLGVTAAAGEEITVYVGHNTKRTGDGTNLQLVSTQYHSEAASMFKVVATLKIGKNTVTIPKLWSQAAETGGALYVQYTSNNANDRYAVRVSGGVQVPMLDLYGKMDEASAQERQSRAEEYVGKLETYVAGIKEKHDEVHLNSDNKLVKYDYEATDCILGASDIMLDTMMLSLPAQQILAGLGNGSTQEKARKLVTSMEAMENMMYLFYQHKGLTKNSTYTVGGKETAVDVKDRFPANHQNIRYQTMFAGAFMYASGNHIGIEWGSATGLMSGVTVKHNNGKYESGQYYGWGIAHEIGHCINQGTYAVAEITNNYFAVLAQAKDTNDSVRFKYSNVYDKVTSGTKGRATNVFTQLGMYWQLHLAYDNGLNYMTYSDYNEQLANLFFARVDSYSRNPGRAPTPNDIILSLCGDKDQDLMRLACVAAEKDVLEFFERWGMTPDADTISYAGQFPKETRAIYYVNDESRVYRLANPAGAFAKADTEALNSTTTTAAVDPNAANKVNMQFNLVSGVNEADVLGYEIVRCITSNGDEEKQIAGFVTGDTFTDTITTMNNRVVTYEVTAIDQHLNRSKALRLAPVKIKHQGEIDKTYWSVSTNNMDATSKVTGDKEDQEYIPCGPEEEAPITAAVDNDTSTTYTGTVKANAEVVIELNQEVTIAGFKYTVNSGTPIKDYSVFVRNEKNEWVEAASGTFTDKVNTVNFGIKDSSNIALYQTSAVKLAIKGQTGTEIAISELDVLGVTGDDVEFRKTEGDGTTAIGTLAEDYKYGDKDGDVIKAGSIVFTGRYKGNAAYNVVILYDQDGNIVGGLNDKNELKAYQVIFSDVDDSDEVIKDDFDGTWIYWIDPKDADLNKLEKVRAELYRVDEATTNKGQRLVSDCIFEEMPAELPNITLSGKKK